MIYTLTLNPSIDYIVESELEIGKTNRSTNESYHLGGKGINVSILLNNLLVRSTVLGFNGGFSGLFINEELKKYAFIKNNLIQTDVNTRINIKLKNDVETEINAKGHAIQKSYISKLEKKIVGITTKDIMIIGGTQAFGMDESWYSMMCKMLNDKKIPFIIDISSKNLLKIIQYQPLLIKPNKHELETLFDKKNMNDSEIINYAKELKNLGAQNVIVSLGENGAIFVNENGVYKAFSPNGVLVDSTGAGDSMVGGFVYALNFYNDSLKAFKYAVACGSATAYSKEIGSKKLIETLYEKIKIEEIYHD